MAQASVGGYRCLVIGGSAGSLEVLLQLLPALALQPFLAIVIVLHRKHTDSLLNQLLNNRTVWPVAEAEDKQPIETGHMYVAPADYHLLIERDKTFALDYSEKLHFCRPCINATLETAAETYGPALAALLLSGANADGTEGLKAVKAAGGFTVVQQPAEAVVGYMPQQAILHAAPDAVAGMAEMIEVVNGLGG